MAINKREKEKRKIRYAAAKEIAEKQQKGFEPTSVEVPKGISFFGFKKEGNYRLDIIPFIAKEGNPHADEGLATWERTYRAHDGIGPEGKRYACLSQNFKKRCPICEHAKKLRNEGADQELIDALEKTKKRQVLRVIDLADPDKGIQLYEGSYYKGLGELIDNKIDASEEDSPYRDFYHLEGGMRLVVKSKQEHFKGRSYFAPVNVEMEPRKKDLEESLLDEDPHPDDCIKEMDYDELKEILLQTAGAEPEKETDEDGEEKPKKKRKEEVDEDEEETDEDEETEDEEDSEDEDEDEPKPAAKKGKGKTAKQLGIKENKFVMYKKEEYEVIKISPDGTSLTLEDQNGKTIKAIDPNLCTLVATKGDEDEETEEEEEETPKVKKGKGKPPSKSDDDEDDEDLEEDEEEETEDEDEDEDEEEPLEDEDDLEDEEDDEEEEERPKRKKK